jgi:hypothetical protein
MKPINVLFLLIKRFGNPPDEILDISYEENVLASDFIEILNANDFIVSTDLVMEQHIDSEIEEEEENGDENSNPEDGNSTDYTPTPSPHKKNDPLEDNILQNAVSFYRATKKKSRSLAVMKNRFPRIIKSPEDLKKIRR